MKYYPCMPLHLDNIDRKLSDYSCSTVRSKTLLTKYGLYRHIGPKLYKFKLDIKGTTQSNSIEIAGIEFKAADSKWMKVREEFAIPPEHMIIEITKSTFSLRPHCKTRFVVEKQNNHICDYYFISDMDISSHSLKEDIASLLFRLN